MNGGMITELLSDLEPFDPACEPQPVASGRPLTVWVTHEVHERYALIQKLSHRKFSKKLRQILVLAIKEAERKLSLPAA